MEQGKGKRCARCLSTDVARGVLAAIPSIWGHRAGSPEGIPADLAFLTSQVRSWLDR
jgi:hypothetical protein